MCRPLELSSAYVNTKRGLGSCIGPTLHLFPALIADKKLKQLGSTSNPTRVALFFCLSSSQSRLSDCSSLEQVAICAGTLFADEIYQTNALIKIELKPMLFTKVNWSNIPSEERI